MKRLSRNFLLLWLRDGLYCLSATLSSASVLQAFFLKMSMADGTVSYYASFTQAVYLAVSLLFAGAADRCRKAKRASTLWFFANAAALLLQTALCLLPGNSVLFCAIAFAVGAFVHISNTIRIIFNYKLICEVIPVERYSLYASISGIVSGAAGILPGFVLPFFYARWDYTAVTLAVFGAGGLFCAAAGAVHGCLRLLPGKEEEAYAEGPQKSPPSAVRAVLGRRDFRRLAVPNFIRGIGAGVVAVLPLLAIRDAGLPEENSALISGIMNAATFFSCALYGFARQKKISATKLNLAGASLFLLLCAAFLGGQTWFLVILFFAYCGYNTVTYAVLDAVYQQVDESVISTYNTWRMALTTLGTVCATAVLGALADAVSGTLLAVCGSVSLFLCCLAYHAVFRAEARGKTDPCVQKETTNEPSACSDDLR